jgi:hypothetical protein
MCYSFEFSQYCSGIASILSLFMITCERYYVICKPLAFKSVITKSRTVKLVILIWIVSILINLPLIFFTNYDIIPSSSNSSSNSTCSNHENDQGVHYKCEMYFDEKFTNWHIYYILMIAFFVFFFLGLVLIFMYYKISQHLKESQNILNKSSNMKSERVRLKVAKSNQLDDLGTINTDTNLIVNKTDTGGSGPAPGNNDFDKFIKPRKQLIFMLQCIIVVFYVCVYPFKLLSLINVFYQLT